jgi:symplekin
MVTSTWAIFFEGKWLSIDKYTFHTGKNWRFDTSRLSQFHPSLDPAVLEADAHRALLLLLDIIRTAYAHRGSFLVGTINS